MAQFLAGTLLYGAVFIPVILGWNLIMTVTMPQTASRMGNFLRTRFRMCFLIGLLIAVVLGFLDKSIPAYGPSSALKALGGMLVLLGLPAMSEAIGQQLFALGDSRQHRLLQITVGWVALGFASLVPFVGWFIVFPFAACTGIGALVLSICSPPSRIGPDRSSP